MPRRAAASTPPQPRTAPAFLPSSRSALTNGSRAFLSANGSSATARLLRDREIELAAPLGGLEGLALGDRLKVEATALLSVRLEVVRSALARGEAGVSDEDLVRLTNGLARAQAWLDKAAVARTKAGKAGLSPAEYLTAKRAAEVAP